MRVESVLSEILSQNLSDNTIVIVTHGGTITQLYHALLKLPIDAKIKFGTGDACLHEWTIEIKKKMLSRVNPLNIFIYSIQPSRPFVALK